MTRKLTVKKEIRTIGIDLCKPKRAIGAVVRGGTLLDGVTAFSSESISTSRSMATSITETKFFPELRLIMMHDSKQRFDLKSIESLTELPIIQIAAAGEKNFDDYNHYKIGKKELRAKSSLPSELVQKILMTTWTTGMLPEPLRIAHMVARSRFYGEKHVFPS